MRRLSFPEEIWTFGFAKNGLLSRGVAGSSPAGRTLFQRFNPLLVTSRILNLKLLTYLNRLEDERGFNSWYKEEYSAWTAPMPGVENGVRRAICNSLWSRLLNNFSSTAP